MSFVFFNDLTVESQLRYKPSAICIYCNLHYCKKKIKLQDRYQDYMSNSKRKTNRKIKQTIKNYDCSGSFNVNFISVSAENIIYI